MSSESKKTAITREERRCRTCRFYEAYVDPVQDGYGTCHRHAPSPKVITESEQQPDFYTVWPFVEFDAFCGDWEWNTELEKIIDDPEQNP